MAKELRVDKECTGVALPYEVKAKLMLKYGKTGETFPAVLNRVLAELVKDVKLPKRTLDEIKAKITANYEKRMQARMKKSLAKSLVATKKTLRNTTV